MSRLRMDGFTHETTRLHRRARCSSRLFLDWLCRMASWVPRIAGQMVSARIMGTAILSSSAASWRSRPWKPKLAAAPPARPLSTSWSQADSFAAACLVSASNFPRSKQLNRSPAKSCAASLKTSLKEVPSVPEASNVSIRGRTQCAGWDQV
ncbi:hypothetical protein GGR56DRAFT_413393 [Xylariaceae sp. FL0804]|nr:hypothetical protein GGR56DRAFT_413393 [Xylariaceae sp. FL0804]